MLVLKQKVAAGTRGDTMKSKVEKAIKMVDTQKAKLDAAEATRAMRLMKLAMRHTGRADVPVWMANHTGSVTLTEWTSFANSLHQWALRDSSSDTSNGQAEGGMAMPAGGFRREILQLAVEAMAKELELSLLMIRALTVEGIIKGHWEKRDQYEELIMSGNTHGANERRFPLLKFNFSRQYERRSVTQTGSGYTQRNVDPKTERINFAVDHDFAVAIKHRKVTAKIHSEIDSLRLNLRFALVGA